MTDLLIAEKNLGAHSICLCRDGKFFTDDGRGISPMIRFIAEGRELDGFSAADIIVGKAAALLFVRAGIAAVYGRVMSESALSFLKSNNVRCEYGTITEKIIDRQGTDICPMEKLCADIDDPQAAFIALSAKLEEMKRVDL